MKRFGLILGLMFIASSYGFEFNYFNNTLNDIEKDLQQNEILYSGSKALEGLNSILDIVVSLDKKHADDMIYHNLPILELFLKRFKIYEYKDEIDLYLSVKAERLKTLFTQIYGDSAYQARRDLLLFIKANLRAAVEPAIESKSAEPGAGEAPKTMFEEMMRVRAKLREVGRIGAKASENLAIAQAAVKYGLKVEDVRKLQDSLDYLKNRGTKFVENLITRNFDPLFASPLVRAQIYFAVQQGNFVLNNAAWEAFLNSGKAGPVTGPKEEKAEAKVVELPVPAAGSSNLSDYFRLNYTIPSSDDGIAKLKSSDGQNNVVILEYVLRRLGYDYSYLKDHDLAKKREELNKRIK